MIHLVQDKETGPKGEGGRHVHKCKQFTPKDNALVKCMTIMTILGIATNIGKCCMPLYTYVQIYSPISVSETAEPSPHKMTATMASKANLNIHLPKMID